MEPFPLVGGEPDFILILPFGQPAFNLVNQGRVFKRALIHNGKKYLKENGEKNKLWDLLQAKESSQQKKMRRKIVVVVLEHNSN